MLRRSPAAPHPLLIEAPWGVRRLEAGETFEFSMVIMGRALHALPLIVLAWAHTCSGGMGGKRVPAVLVGYRAEGEMCWRDPMAATAYAAMGVTIPAAPHGPTHIRFATPFRARKDGALCSPRDLRFRELISHLQRRWGLLQAFHEIGRPWEWDYQHALEQAAEISWEPLDAHWVDWSRYSSRQKQSMQLGGVVGTYRIPDEALAKFWPLLYLGQWIHVGKNASFGLGRYTLSNT